MSDSNTTININLNDLVQDKAQNSSLGVINCPMPWPFPWPGGKPFPFPFPWPTGGPFDYMQGQDGSGVDPEIGGIFYEGIRVALSAKMSSNIKPSEMIQHLDEDVLPRLRKAETAEDVNATMAKVYDAFPTVKEFAHAVTDKYGTGEGGDVLGKKKVPKWLIALLEVVVAVIKLFIIL